MNKTVKDVEEALSGIEDGATVAIGGFFAAGVPRTLLRALIDKGTKNLTLACGSGPLLGAKDELNLLVQNDQIKKVIDSYSLFRSATKGAQHPFEQKVRAGEIELEIYPMGTLCEKYRMAGAGIPACFMSGGRGFAGGRSSHHKHRRETAEAGNAGSQRANLHSGICAQTRFRSCSRKRGRSRRQSLLSQDRMEF